MNILQTIAGTKRREVRGMKKILPQGLLEELAKDVRREPLSMRDSILNSEWGIIAEHKRRSPSKGEISPMSEVAGVADAYSRFGAAAMSVLTDTPYFGGSLTDLAVAREAAPGLPLLRKEFIVDKYQLLEARIYGADTVLLIAAMLTRDEIFRLNDYAHSLGLQTLVELHSPEEMDRLPDDADLVGVNNRDLTSFKTDLSNSSRMMESLPKGTVKIAESGIKTPYDMMRLRDLGFDGFLIGEALMSRPSPESALREFADFKS